MAQTPAMCTIIAKNYVAVARTLCRSFLEQHPDGRCYVLIIDDFAGFIDPAAEPFEVITPDVLAVPHLPSFAFQYDIVELSTAYKPFLMKHLLERDNLDALLYLDPDIQVFSPLDGIYAALQQHDIVLTPHLDQDYPPDGCRPNTGNIIKHGIYNLGFIGASRNPNALRFLEWWQAKLYHDCVISPDGSQYVDQKIINIVPTIFSNVFVESGIGYNVAYWNLHSRTVSRDGQRWYSNGVPLGFFHFSSYDPYQPDLITKPVHMNRYTMADRPDLAELFAQYRTQVLENGYEQTRHWKYSLDEFASGAAIPAPLRVRYRSISQEWQRYGNPFQSPELQRLARLYHLRAKMQAVRSRLAFRTRLTHGLRKALGK